MLLVASFKAWVYDARIQRFCIAGCWEDLQVRSLLLKLEATLGVSAQELSVVYSSKLAYEVRCQDG